MQLKIKEVLSTSILLSAVGLNMAACSNKLSSSNAKNANHSIALVTNSAGVDDHSFNRSVWGGLKCYGKAHDLLKGNGGYNYFESSSASDHIPNIEQAINTRYRTIVGVGYGLGDTISTESKKHPKNNLIMIDNVINCENVASATFRSNDASCLAGYAATYATKTDVVGSVGDTHRVILNLLDAGFAKGVADTAKKQNKKIKIINVYVGGFSSVDKAKAIAKAVYANKADVTYQIAATVDEGVFQEAKDINTKRAANDKVWAISVDSDQSSLGVYKDKDGEKSNFTLTNTIKGIGKAVEDIANRAYDDGSPGGKHFAYDLKGNGTYVIKGNTSDSAWAAVNKAKQNVIDGKVKVPTTSSN